MARSGRGWDAKPPPAPATRGRVANRRRGPTLPTSEDAASSPDARPDPQEPVWGDGDGHRAVADSGREPDGWRERSGSGREPDGWRERSGSRGGGDGEPWRATGSRGDGDGRRVAREAHESQQAARDPQEVAREICLRLLAVRPRTRAELAQALSKRRIDAEVSAAVLNRYDEVGMIDDAAFARAWVTSRHHGRGLASRALAQELRRRGVSKEDTDEALSELDPETEAKTALDLAIRKLKSMRGEPEAIFRRLVGMLARKGYPPGVALRAVKEALASRDSEAGAESWGDGGWDKQVELIDPDAYEE